MKNRRTDILRRIARTGSPADRRMAELMLAGPEITEADIERLRYFVPRPKVIAMAVHFALLSWS